MTGDNPVTEKETQVIKIDPKGKYYISVDHKSISQEELDKIQQKVSEWWHSDFPFIFLSPDVKLVKFPYELKPIEPEEL